MIAEPRAGRKTRPAAAPPPDKIRRDRRSRALRKFVTIALFLLPALALYLLLVVLPLIQVIRYSGYKWNGLGPPNDFVGFDNFKRALGDDVFRGAIKHNLIIVVLSVCVQLPFALGVAMLVNARLKGRALLRLLFFAPFVLSEVITAVVFNLMLQPGGLIDFGGKDWLGDTNLVLYTCFVALTWKYFGFHMIIYLAGLQQIPRELEEAAMIDGARPREVFRHVTLPLLGPTIRISAFLSIIGALQVFDLIWVMTGGGPVNASNTMAIYVIDWGFKRFQFGYASAVAVILLAMALVFALLYQRFVLRRDLEGALTTMGN